jgi:hypothetical protein
MYYGRSIGHDMNEYWRKTAEDVLDCKDCNGVRPASYGIQYKNYIFLRHLKALIARVKVNWSVLSRLVRSATLPKPKSDV